MYICWSWNVSLKKKYFFRAYWTYYRLDLTIGDRIFDWRTSIWLFLYITGTFIKCFNVTYIFDLKCNFHITFWNLVFCNKKIIMSTFMRVVPKFHWILILNMIFTNFCILIQYKQTYCYSQSLFIQTFIAQTLLLAPWKIINPILDSSRRKTSLTAMFWKHFSLVCFDFLKDGLKSGE